MTRASISQPAPRVSRADSRAHSHSLTHSPSRSLTYSPTHSLTHSPTARPALCVSASLPRSNSLSKGGMRRRGSAARESRARDSRAALGGAGGRFALPPRAGRIRVCCVGLDHAKASLMYRVVGCLAFLVASVGVAAEPPRSFRPVGRPAPPKVRGAASTDIDRFILAALEARGLGLSPEADRATLIRRVCFDLTGLPPTPAEVEQFLADRSSDAYDRMVDRYLASPHYGERWGKYW